MSRFTIVGAGLAGALLGVCLRQAGHEVVIYERRPDMRAAEVPRGRSINLALSVRGWHALEEVGLREQVMRVAIPMEGRMLHGRDGSLELQRYSIHPDEFLYSVSRHGLNVFLIDAAEAHGVEIHFEQRCTRVDLDGGRVWLRDERSGAVREVEGGHLIGADGAFSAVREQMTHRERFDYHQNYLPWGYKELSMPAAEGGGWRLERGALHIWPRHDFMLIALPNLDGSFTCTLFLPFDGPRDSFAALSGDDEVRTFFTREFGDAVPHMPTLLDDFHHNPTSGLVYVRCLPWHVGDRAVLVGDACHAVVPFYGQGMNAAFEDCTVLMECLRAEADTEAAFARYEALRKPNTDALADLSLANFEEMRSRVVSPVFKAKKRAEAVLHRMFPQRFLPLYSMVTFSRIPYAEALAKARRQDRMLEALAAAAALGGAAALGACLTTRSARAGDAMGKAAVEAR
jgi:kynurenine 3-monooxygenase